MLKYFFSWGQKYTLSYDEKIKITPALLEQAKDCFSLTKDFLIQHPKLKIMDLLSHGINKKVFEGYLLYKDIINLPNSDYSMQYYFSTDAKTSGLQINAMTLNSRKLAMACGLINNTSNDFYTQFLDHFTVHIENLTNIFHGWENHSISSKFITLAKIFITKHYLEFHKCKFLENLNKNKKFFKEFIDLFKSLDLTKDSNESILEIESTLKNTDKNYNYVQRRVIYNLLIDENIIIKRKKPKVYSLTTILEIKTKHINIGKIKLNLILYLLELIYEKTTIEK